MFYHVFIKRMHFLWWQFFISDIVMLGSDIAGCSLMILPSTQESAAAAAVLLWYYPTVCLLLSGRYILIWLKRPTIQTFHWTCIRKPSQSPREMEKNVYLHKQDVRVSLTDGRPMMDKQKESVWFHGFKDFQRSLRLAVADHWGFDFSIVVSVIIKKIINAL